MQIEMGSLFTKFSPQITNRTRHYKHPHDILPARLDARTTPLITVAICTRNRAASLARAIQSVLPQLGDFAELLVVDNGSTDNTPTFLESVKDSRVTIISESAPGISYARNRALAEARGNFVLFFDDDEAAAPNWLNTYRDFLINPPPNLGAVGGPYVADFEVPPPNWINEGFGAYNLGSERKELFGPATPAAGNCAYLRNAARAAGGFATDLLRSEDSELNLRLLQNGFKIWWLPEAQVRHFIPASRLTLRSQLAMAFAEGRATVVFRLRSFKSSSPKILFCIGRILVTPLLILLQCTVALLCLVFLQKKRGYRLLVRAARSVGIFWHLLPLPQKR